MDAIFTYAARYQVTAHCETPLRTGGADGDTEVVLRRRDGGAFIQGSSLAGALRAWLAIERPETEKPLFGAQENVGRLIVSDGQFDADAQQSIRPRLRIDAEKGSAALGGKFDVAHINAGGQFEFTLTWLGSKERADELEVMEEMLAAVNDGAIRLGAQKTNGFGRVTLRVKKRVLDLTRAEDREAWLSDSDEGEQITLPRARRNHRREVLFTVNGYAESILIKASSEKQDQKGSCIENLTEKGQAVLPGSSVKGAVRARVFAIAGLLGISDETIDAYFGRGAADGDNGRQGQIRFADAVLAETKRKITRIRINRFTGGVIRGGLFSEEPRSGEVTLKIAAPAEEPAACGLLLYALRDLGLGLYNLGSGAAVGRGFLTVREIVAEQPDGSRASLRFGADGVCTMEDEAGILRGWLEAVGGIKHEN